MTTFTQMNALTSVKDFSSDLVRELIGKYCVRGKEIDPATEDPMKLLNRVDWLINRVGRALKVGGKLDADKTSFRIDRSAENILSVRFVDLKGKTLYTLTLGEAGKLDKEHFEYILTDATGNVVVCDHKWKAIAEYFAPEKEVVVRKAAAPKKTAKANAKKEKAVKAVKSPVPAAAPETDPIAEATTLNEDVPPAELG